jgi:hypothetical protein
MKRTLLLALAFVATLGSISLAQFGGPGVNSTFPGVWNFVWEPGTGKATYSATESAMVMATTQRQFLQINGSATKTIRIRRVLLEGTTAAGVIEPVFFNKISTAQQGAAVVGTALTATPLDSSSAAATATVEVFNVSPATDPTVVGEIMAPQIPFQLSTAARGVREFFFGQGGSAIILRSASEGLSLNLAGGGLTASIVNVTVEWTEE